MSELEFEEVLAHYGVKGMRWGVRKENRALKKQVKFDSQKGELVLSKPCKNGTEISIYRKNPGKFEQAMADRFESSRKSLAAHHAFVFADKTGAKVGEASFTQSSKTSLDLEWIGINKNARSNGYARAALEGVIEHAQKTGITEMNLTATGMGRPLYESLGFEHTGGSYYTLKVPQKVSHALFESDLESLLDRIIKNVDNDPSLNDDINSTNSREGLSHMSNELPSDIMQSDSDLDDILAHYGVKGMKWGVRKDRGDRDAIFRKRAKEKNPVEVSVSQQPGKYVKGKGGQNQPASEDAITAATYRQRAKASTVDSLSNKELQTLVTRMNLEQQYSNLSSQSDRRSRGAKIANQIVGKENPFRDTALSNIDKRDAKLGRRVRFVATAIDLVTSGPKKKKK